jgi:hypothetical protein
MPTINRAAPSRNIATTTALSVSKVLPDGVVAFRNGLQLPESLPQEQWVTLGSQISELAGSALWLVGDWLAFGQRYHGVEGYKRLEHGIYAKVAESTGFSEQRLKNAKWVCSKVELSRRRDGLTFSAAEEIVARAAPNQIDFWIDKATTAKDDGRLPTAKNLREELRKSKAVYKQEPNDTGTTSSLAITDQYVRDMLALDPGAFKASLKQAHLRNLKPLLEKLASS